MSPHIAVVGAGYAGCMALGRIRMHCPSARITLVEPRSHFEERVRLHQVAAGALPIRVDLAELCGRFQVEHLRDKLTDRSGRKLTLSSGSSLEPDAVLLALGSRTRPPPGPAYVLDSDGDAAKLHRALLHRPDARITVVGAGTTALELATALAGRFPSATLTLWRASAPDPTDRATPILEQRLKQLGIIALDGGPVVGLDSACAWSATHRIEHEIAVWCGGFEAIRCGEGLRHADGRLKVDRFLHLGEGVFAAGDQAIPPTPHRFGCVTAMPTGAHAALNLVRWLRGEPLQPFRLLDAISCVDLGQHHGLLQSRASDQHVYGGRVAGAVKGGILGYITLMLKLERTLRFPVYRWPQGPIPRENR